MPLDMRLNMTSSGWPTEHTVAAGDARQAERGRASWGRDANKTPEKGLVQYPGAVELSLIQKQNANVNEGVIKPSFDDLFTEQRIRKNILNSVCLERNLTRPFKKIDQFVAKRLFVEPNHKFIYCEVPKVGCSNWKRIILLLKMNLSLRADYIEHDAIHNTALLKRLNDYPADMQQMMLNNYTKVMFTRDPLQRIVSAYRDKFLHSGGYYGTHIANIIRSKIRKNNKSNATVSFEEFVRYILQQKASTLDIHWIPMHYLCDPCNIKYDILGKFQTLKKDSDYVLKTIGAPDDLKYPEIKQYNETRTDTDIASKYFTQLPLNLFQLLVDVYRLDFMLFGYS
ncbi:carbohydrate sulfotransferase 9-like [Rhinophrynus dorsalis]